MPDVRLRSIFTEEDGTPRIGKAGSPWEPVRGVSTPASSSAGTVPRHRSLRSAVSPHRRVRSAVPSRAHDGLMWLGLVAFWGFVLWIFTLSFGVWNLTGPIESFTMIRLVIFGLVCYILAVKISIGEVSFRVLGLPSSVVGFGSALILLFVPSPVFSLDISRLFVWSWWKNLHNCFVAYLLLACLLLFGTRIVKNVIGEVVFKYKIWKLLDLLLGTKTALALSDCFREMIPSLAPCNPFLEGAVVSSAQKTQFVAMSSYSELDILISPEIERLIEEVTPISPLSTEEPLADSYSFQIGSGEIHIDAFGDCNFKFESIARGRLLENFFTIMDSNSVAIIVNLLQYWETSPDLGVIENLHHVPGDGIYCHCLSLQSLVEGVCKSTQFSLHRMSESARFYVGCIPQGNRREENNQISLQQKLFTFTLAVWSTVSSYLLVTVSRGNHVVAIVGLCIGLIIASLVFMDGHIRELPFKLLLHWVLTCFCTDLDSRYRFYLWLKRNGCFLAFCDDFNPVLHHANEEVELITLWKCTTGQRTKRVPVPYPLKWPHVKEAKSSNWEWDGRKFVPFEGVHAEGDTTTLKTTVRTGTWPEGTSDFEWHQAKNRYFELTLSERTVSASSVGQNARDDSELGEGRDDMWITELQLDDGEVESLVWKEQSYDLFIYLMVGWKSRKFGVICDRTKFWYANYYHVFSTYDLARHIRDNEKEESEFYYRFYEAPGPRDMVAGYPCKDLSADQEPSTT